MSGGSSVSTVSSVASAKGTFSGAQSRVLVRLKVGHTSEILPQPTAIGHTHRWTVFVKAPGPLQFTDRSLLKKVTFMLHQSFVQPKRVIKEPPFQVTETGYGGFTMPITLQFSGVQKVYTINYDLSLSMDKYGEFALEHKIELKNPPKEISDLVQKYCSYKKEVVDKVIQKQIPSAEKRPPKTKSKEKSEHKSSANENALKSSAPKITISTPTAPSTSSSATVGHKSGKSSGEKRHESSKSENRKHSTSSIAPKIEDTKDVVAVPKKEKSSQPASVVKLEESKKLEKEDEHKEKRHKEKKKKKDKDRDSSKERHKEKEKKKKPKEQSISGVDEKREPKLPQTPPPAEDSSKLKRKREDEDEIPCRRSRSPGRHSPKKTSQIIKTEPNSPSRAPDHKKRPHSSMANSPSRAPEHKKRPHSSMANAITLIPPPASSISPFGFSPATPCGSAMLNEEQDEESQAEKKSSTVCSWSSAEPVAPPTTKPISPPTNQPPDEDQEEEQRAWSEPSSPLRLDSRLQKLMDQLNDIRDSELLYLCADTLIEYDASVVNIDKHGRMDFDLCQVKIETVGILEQVFSTFYNNTSSKR